jgi:hypothetical protein
MVSSGKIRRVARIRTDLSVELSAAVIRVARIGELGTTDSRRHDDGGAKFLRNVRS